MPTPEPTPTPRPAAEPGTSPAQRRPLPGHRWLVVADTNRLAEQLTAGTVAAAPSGAATTAGQV